MKKIQYILAVIIFLFLGAHTVAYAQDGVFSGVSESFVAGVKDNVTSQVDELCGAVPIISRIQFSLENFTDTLSSTLLEPFVDLQRVSCYRTVLWEIDDEISAKIDSYADMSYDLCAESVREEMGIENRTMPLNEVRLERLDIFNEINFMRDGVSLLRRYGSKGAYLNPEEIEKIYGVSASTFNNAMFRELTGLTTDMDDHLYYCPLLQNANIMGIDVVDSEWHQHYESILTDDEKKDPQKRRKRVQDECASKWSTVLDKISELLASIEYNGTIVSRDNFNAKYSALSQLSNRDLLALYKKAKSALLTLPHLVRRVNMCTDDALGDFVATMKKIISMESVSKAFDDMTKKIQEKKKEMQMAAYDRICNNIIAARKNVGGTLKDLPFLKKIDEVYYCTRPDNSDKTFEKSFNEYHSKSLKELTMPKGMDEIIMENTEASIRDAMTRQLDEWSRYQFEVDTVKQRAMYRSLYDTGTDGVSTALVNLMNDFITTLQTTVSTDSTRNGRDAVPITKAIWDALYDLQERQDCGKCSLKKDDLKIIKAKQE